MKKLTCVLGLLIAWAMTIDSVDSRSQNARDQGPGYGISFDFRSSATWRFTSPTRSSVRLGKLYLLGSRGALGALAVRAGAVGS